MADDPVDAALRYYANYFGIAGETTQLRDKMAATAAVETPTHYAISLYDGKNRWPLRNAEEVKSAASHLLRYRSMFEYPIRKEAAVRILRTAREFDVELDTNLRASLSKIAGHGTCSKEQILATIGCRTEKLKGIDSDVCQQLQKVAESVMATPATARDNDNLVKLANVLDELDAAYIKQPYSDNWTAPEDVLFNISLDDVEAVKSAYVQTPTGSVYEKIALEQLSPATLQEWLGVEFAKAATVAGLLTVDADSLTGLLADLPASQQEMFDKMAASVGIEPAIRLETNATDLPLSSTRLMSLALSQA